VIVSGSPPITEELSAGAATQTVGAVVSGPVELLSSSSLHDMKIPVKAIITKENTISFLNIIHSNFI
jgi:hypothetical protein